MTRQLQIRFQKDLASVLGTLVPSLGSLDLGESDCLVIRQLHGEAL